jgi:DNA-binding NtrC family response regulator
MIKRFVILQDENLVMRELTKPRTIAPNPAGVTAPPPGAPPRDYMAAPPAAQPVPPPAASAPAGSADEDDTDDLDDTPPPASTADGRRLADVAREASLAAERIAISDTLRQVHWNRRKAAQILGVSYKTLLNKIKETGIERP